MSAVNCRSIVVCLMVPSGDWDLAPLVAAIAHHHPEWTLTAVWCGDPQRRPVLVPSLRTTWSDIGLGEPSGAGWNRLVVALPQRIYEWCRTAAAVQQLLDTGVEQVVVLRVGSVAVLGDISALVGSAALTLVERAPGGLPVDGLSPDEADLVQHGQHSVVVASFAGGSQPGLVWLAERLVDAHGQVGPWLDRMGSLFGAGACADARVGVSPWRVPTPTSSAVSQPMLLDFDLLDREQPWSFVLGGGPARVRLSSQPVLAAAVRDGLVQMAGTAAPIRLPGGIAIDDAIRSLMTGALHAWRTDAKPLPPEPFGPQNSAFVEWLESPYEWGAEVGRYWLELHATRADLRAAFPRPQSFDAGPLIDWANTNWRIEQRSMLVRSSAGTWNCIASIGCDPGGINVLGYLDFDQSQGHIAREIVAALEQAHVPVSPLNHHRSLGARHATTVTAAREARYATNIVVVNADQFLFVVADHGATLLEGRRTIGYWFWELEHVPETMVRAIDDIDEIWAGSRFVAEAFARVTDKPVHVVPLPIAEPQPSERDRGSFGLPDDRFVFLATFDQFSVPERKNPFGVIEAFTRAFRDGEGPLLWIKTLNGDKNWREHERLLLAASGRSDIVVWDGHLDRADQMAVLRAADCLVSLHRSEGLGLHCAEAMWLGKPVIATRYSGNLDFMDDDCAALIDYQLVPVRHGGGIYPPVAVWAEPDTEQAAAWMRRLVGDRELGAHMGARARARMEAQPTLADTGRLMASLAGVRVREGDESWD
ncbi:unannotated protein [freshwater metagenome]|uniref:Unannotated protein n=1 Tax=freshwater metagenome TaxID=449393 RepID=A0A6J7EXU8_9ZZZZ|nr:glycosyltransferase [Actinomycetota bacterium]